MYFWKFVRQADGYVARVCGTHNVAGRVSSVSRECPSVQSLFSAGAERKWVACYNIIEFLINYLQDDKHIILLGKT